MRAGGFLSLAACYILARVDFYDCLFICLFTAGQEKYFTITTGYYRQADAVVLVCDLTNADSFARLDKWMQEVLRHARPGTPCVLLGNKSDLGEATRKVSAEDAQQWAKAQGMQFFEVQCCGNDQYALALFL